MTRKKITPPPRTQQFKNPLDRAHGWEVVWEQVAPVFEMGRQVADACYVYFVGEQDDGHIKIGSAKDPVLRLRGLQTGNPRRLRIEHVLLGRDSTERLLHEMWDEYAVTSKIAERKRARGWTDAAPRTEWFKPEIRERLAPIIVRAADRQVEFFNDLPEDSPDTVVIDPDDLEACVREAHGEHGFVAKRRDEVRLLGAHGGYVTPGRRIRI